jgi:hypothetical protein
VVLAAHPCEVSGFLVVLIGGMCVQEGLDMEEPRTFTCGLICLGRDSTAQCPDNMLRRFKGLSS